ncbi:coiled-coil domain-containing protein 152-like [Hypomesus transpacificus]|uniref:coiled-coil domain-containing protein 152-like n=1 Tax=Hypomesus transpacificus TaxID=137520 RepID=UPI001F08419B|nr:coiled-coil domain-containing protein 152-like [Hypomesus transpacificus]
MEINKCTSVNLDKLIDNFTQLEQTITELKGRNNILEIKLDEADRVLKFAMTKEMFLIEGEWSDDVGLTVENEKLKSRLADLIRQHERTVEEREAEVRSLVAERGVVADAQQRELETVRQQCGSEVERVRSDTRSQLEDKEAEVRELLERKEGELEDMRQRLRDKERERQSEMLKLQMEFGAEMARVQSTSQRILQPPQGSGLQAQNIFKRKLHFLQEEKNREIESLRQRIKELEQQHASGHYDSRLKRKKT